MLCVYGDIGISHGKTSLTSVVLVNNLHVSVAKLCFSDSVCSVLCTGFITVCAVFSFQNLM